MRFNVLTIILADAKYKNKNEMDTLYLLQFACFLFMFINILILGITRLHMKWMNRRYEVPATPPSSRYRRNASI